MALVLALSVVVIATIGAVIGGLIAHYLPRLVLYLVWAALAVGTVYSFMIGRTLGEYDRISANMLAFGVLLPLLVGSLITGVLVLRK